MVDLSQRDHKQQLKDLTEKQTALFNANAPEEDRIAVLRQIQQVQKNRAAGENKR